MQIQSAEEQHYLSSSVTEALTEELLDPLTMVGMDKAKSIEGPTFGVRAACTNTAALRQVWSHERPSLLKVALVNHP